MPRFTPEFLDELKSRLRPSDVIGRYVKLRKQGNEWAGLSPFTKEKTPSFFVNDQKGFYHCFSSGKHGDIIRFLTETQGLTFHEAVARLAEEAGLALPAEDPGEAERAVKRKGLAEACAAAAGWFAATLKRAEGRPGAEYLKARGVTEAQVAAFGLGYAGEGRVALKDYLINKGYTEETLLEAGLLVKPEDGGAAYDRFRHRVMFPILGANDQVIAFGGRALDKEARAKYLNSPETPLFHKGNVLYNYTLARKAAADDKQPLIVCEGYMDVIGLWGAGFRRAVAPLGTALAEAQLALAWRVSDEPVLCFDGDRAGIAAAYRAIDRALPLLKPGKSLSFVFLPDGQDPDDIVRNHGPEAFARALAGALPLVEVLWRRETESRPLDTPERRAALRSHLREMTKSIADKDVRAAYGADLAARLEAVFAPPRRDRDAGGRSSPRAPAGGPRRPFDPRQRPEALPSGALRRKGAPSTFSREATLILAVLNHPALFERCEEALMGLIFEDPGLGTLHRALIDALLADPALDSTGLKGHLRTTKAADILERVLSDVTLNRQTFLRTEAELDEVEWGWSDALRHHLFATNAQAEVADTAAQSCTNGEDVWKAAVTARQELLNAGDADARHVGDEGVSSTDLLKRLESFGASVKDKGRR